MNNKKNKKEEEKKEGRKEGRGRWKKVVCVFKNIYCVVVIIIYTFSQ
jgi:hypothetical protein